MLEETELISGDEGADSSSETGDCSVLDGDEEVNAFLKVVRSLLLCVRDDRDWFFLGVCGGVKMIEDFGETEFLLVGLEEWKSSPDLLVDVSLCMLYIVTEERKGVEFKYR